MRIRGIWQEASSYQKLMIFMMLVFLCAFIFTAFAGVLINFFYGFNLLTNNTVLSDIKDPAVLGSLKLLQIISATGTFIVPALIGGYCFSEHLLAFLCLDKKPALSGILAVMTLVLVSTPVINYLMVLNQNLTLPSILKPLEQWMQQSEAKAAELTEAFMKMTDGTDLFINLLMIGLIPAIGEELIFRGVIQRLFKGMIKNSFVAIFLTSILFSAMHLQFYGFLPRMALGMLLGYLLEWSGSLWLPVTLHFLNNGAAVLLTYFYPDTNLDKIGTASEDLWQLLVSCLLTAVLIFYIYYKSTKQMTSEEKLISEKNF